MIEGSGSIPLTSGSGSLWPKNIWIRIRIRIRNTGLWILLFTLMRNRIAHLALMWIPDRTERFRYDANLKTSVLEQSMGARNREGIGLSYRRASLHKLPEPNPWYRLLCSLKVKNTVSGLPPSVYFPLWSRDQWFWRPDVWHKIFEGRRKPETWHFRLVIHRKYT
jgi:hypothetical protein